MNEGEAERVVKAEMYSKTTRVNKKERHVNEIAIVGFWRLNIKGEFTCYRHCKIPNPYKREVRKDKNSELRVFEVLYNSCQNEVFFFFDDSKALS